LLTFLKTILTLALYRVVLTLQDRPMTRVTEGIPRDERKRVELAGRATLGNGPVVEVIVTNVSRHGCEIYCDETLLISTTIKVDAPAIERLSGHVRWSVLGKAGLRFAAGHG
jgi:hypothetical protein